MLRNGVDLKLHDYRYLNWSHRRYSSGTAGTFLKAYDKRRGDKIYYKMSDFNYEQGIVGHECINEIICDRLFYLLGIDHLRYRLLHALVLVEDREYETYICASDDFKRPGESKIALDDFYDLKKKPGESRMEFCTRMGWADYIYQMTVADFLVINRDRHGANLEVLKSGDTYRLAPLFDHGLSLLFSAHTEEDVEKFDPMRDMKVQSFLGGYSLYDNLKGIPANDRPLLRRLDVRDMDMLFQDLDGILSEEHLKKIWQIIWGRWCYYEDLCHQR